MNSIGEQFKPMPPHGKSRLVDGDRLHVTPTPRTPPNTQVTGRGGSVTLSLQSLSATAVRCTDMVRPRLRSVRTAADEHQPARRTRNHIREVPEHWVRRVPFAKRELGE